MSSRCHDNRSKRIIPHILTDDVTQPSACALSVGFSKERKKNKQPPRSVTHSVKHLSRETSHTLHTLDPRGRSSCAIPPCAIILALSASWKLSFRPAAAVDVVLIRIGPLSPIELLTSVLSFSGLNGLLIGVIAPWAEVQPFWWTIDQTRGCEEEEGRPPGGGRAYTSEIRSGFQLSLNQPYWDS